jgi:hypothetical protein
MYQQTMKENVNLTRSKTLPSIHKPQLNLLVEKLSKPTNQSNQPRDKTEQIITAIRVLDHCLRGMADG